MMSTELSIVIKATIMLVLGLASARLAAHSRASVRHLLLAATFGVVLALPLIAISAPGLTIDVPIVRAGDSVAAIGPTAYAETLVSTPGNNPGPQVLQSGRRPVASWQTIAGWTWMAGAMLLLAWLGVDLWRLGRLRRQSLACPEIHDRVQMLAAEHDGRRSVEVLLHEEIAAPFTCGLWCPAIVLPSDAREWSEDDLRRALVHELEHVRRGDWVIQLAARVTCACYWFHPLVWVAWRRMCLEAERACDDAVVQAAERTDYAEQLLFLARRMSAAAARPALGMANRSDLSTRVSAVLDGSQRRGRAGLSAAAGVVSIATVALMGIAPIRAVAQQSISQTIPQKIETAGARRASELDRALYEAAASGEVVNIDRFLSAGANVNAEIRGDGSPLIGAARNGQLAAVAMLLDRGADPDMPVRGDGNPLIMAARSGHLDVVALLLDRGASIDRVVADDENALIQASGRGHLAVVQFLVRRGANVNTQLWVERTGVQPSSELRTPLSMARRGKHRAVEEFLISVGARE